MTEQNLGQLLELAMRLPQPIGWKGVKSRSQPDAAERIIKFLGTRKHPTEIDRATLVWLQQDVLTMWPGKKKGTSLSPGSINGYMSALRKLMELAEEREWIEHAPRFPKDLEIPKRKSFTIKHEWEELALWWLRKNGYELEADLWQFLLHTACRISEALDLTYSDIDLEVGLLTFRDTKNGEDRTIPIPKAVRPALCSYREHGESYQNGRYRRRVWPISYDTFHTHHKAAVKWVVQELDLEPHVKDQWVTHTLRKTGLTRYAGGQLGNGERWGHEQLAKLSGHKTAKMVQHYVDQAALDLQGLMNG